MEILLREQKMLNSKLKLLVSNHGNNVIPLDSEEEDGDSESQPKRLGPSFKEEFQRKLLTQVMEAQKEYESP